MVISSILLVRKLKAGLLTGRSWDLNPEPCGLKAQALPSSPLSVKEGSRSNKSPASAVCHPAAFCSFSCLGVRGPGLALP